MRSAIVPGATFPDYELSDHTAKRRKLSELQGPHPMVLVLSRGGYCPKDRRQERTLFGAGRGAPSGCCREPGGHRAAAGTPFHRPTNT